MDADIPMDDAALVDAHGEPPPTDSEQLPTAAVVKKWTPEQLFGFAPIRKILWNEKNRTTFWNAEINGDTFLDEGDRPDFWRVACGLAAGPSSQLSRLVSSIRGLAEETVRIAEEAERIAEEAERDERIKSENSRAVCDPKAIAN